jgi:selenocysteine-specific elongation factor
MPQTREHLDICQLIGVRRGVVGATKSDHGRPRLAGAVGEEVRAILRGGFWPTPHLVPVSARTGAGPRRPAAELVRLCDQVPARSAEGTLRLRSTGSSPSTGSAPW